MAWENVYSIKKIDGTPFSFMVLDYALFNLPTTGTVTVSYGLPNDGGGNPTYAQGAACKYMYEDALYRGAINIQSPSTPSGSVTFKGGGRIVWTVSGTTVNISFTIAGCSSTTIATSQANNQSWFVWLQVDWANEKANIGYAYGNKDNFLTRPNQSYTAKSLTTDADLLFDAVVEGLIKPDPYNNGGTSTTGGGMGLQTFTSDTISEPSIPSLTPQGSRLLTLYKVDSTILASFANYLWAGGIDFATLHNIFNDTMGAVISLAVCPFTPSGNTPQNLWFGNFDSGVSATLVNSQYETVDCGSVTLSEEYKSVLDYNPYCKIELCLPYCGNISLDPDEVMDTTISIKYKVDLLTGACLACVFADGNLLVTMAGNVLSSIPLTASDHKSIVSSVAGTAISAAGAALAVYTGGLSAPAAATQAASVSAANTLNMKERYAHGGTGNANTALLGPQKPYLIIKWARQCLPLNHNNYVGYPSMITSTLGDLSGFTKVHEIHLENIPCTKGEREELESILKGGFII